MDESEMMERLRRLSDFEDMERVAEEMYEIADPDLVQEWPQSGERFRGRDRIAEMNRSYEGETGTRPQATLRRILKPGEAWVVESTIDYGDGTPVSSVSIIETGPDGKVIRQTDYFANPFEAPDWRKPWAEPATQE